MDAYVFQAALLCDECATRLKPYLSYSKESDIYPQGPYADGGGEADSPNHCDFCQVFLENMLTSDGESYVREAVKNRENDEWEQFYYYLF